jgi:hypothetical protein
MLQEPTKQFKGTLECPATILLNSKYRWSTWKRNRRGRAWPERFTVVGLSQAHSSCPSVYVCMQQDKIMDDTMAS